MYTFGIDSQGANVVVSVNGSTLMRSHGDLNQLERTTTNIELDATQTYEISVVSMRQKKAEGHALRFGWGLPQEESEFTGGELEVAKQADAVIAVMGLSVEYERESIDRAFEGLPTEQTDMLQGIVSANPNTVVVLQSGSSIESPELKAMAPAILQSWYPGEQGGTAIANTLFGDNNPGGKLPLTFVKSWDDLPAFNDYDISKGRTYLYFEKEPLWAFGHGLSYTTFELDSLNVKEKSVAKNGTIRMDVTVKNTGERAGDEVVQVYVKDLFDRSEKPLQRLKAFERVTVEAGESKVVNLSIDAKDLAYWDEQKSDWALGDRYEIRVGNASDNVLLSETITLK